MRFNILEPTTQVTSSKHENGAFIFPRSGREQPQNDSSTTIGASFFHSVVFSSLFIINKTWLKSFWFIHQSVHTYLYRNLNVVQIKLWWLRRFHRTLQPIINSFHHLSYILRCSPLLLNCRVQFKFNFFSFCNKPIWLAHHATKLKLWRLPEAQGSILMYRVPALSLTYTGEKRTIFAKAYGIKVRCYGEHVGEPDGNPLGTWKEHSENTLGTRETLKNILPPPPKLKRKKGKAPWVHACAFPLPAWNFSSQKSSSPFLAWANTPCKKHPTHWNGFQLVLGGYPKECQVSPILT